MRLWPLLSLLPVVSASCNALPHEGAVPRSFAHEAPESGFQLTATPPDSPSRSSVDAAAVVQPVSADVSPTDVPFRVRQAAFQPPDVPNVPAESPPTPPPAPVPVSPENDAVTQPPADAFGTSDTSSNVAGGLTLDTAVAMALAANPAIGAAHHAVQRSQGEWTQVGLYPNPITGYMASEMGQEGRAGQQGIFAQQVIPLGDKLQLNRAVSSGDVAIARQAVEAQRFRVQTDVQTRFYEVLGSQQLVEIARRTEGYGEQSLEATRRLEEAGESSKADVLLAVTGYQQLRVARQQAEANYDAAWRRLAVMIGQPSMTPMPLIGQLETPRRPGDFEALWQHIRAGSPELQAASAAISRARARIAREQATTIPDIDAQLALQQDAATDYTIGSAQIGFMLPIHQKNEGGIAAAHAEYCRRVKEYERIELNLRDRLVAALREADVAARQVDTYGESIVPAAEEGLSLVREGYEGGQYDVLRLVTAQQTYANALQGYVQAQADLQQALAVLDGQLLTGGLDEPIAPPGVDTPESLTDVPKAQ